MYMYVIYHPLASLGGSAPGTLNARGSSAQNWPNCGMGDSLHSKTANLRANIHANIIYKIPNFTFGSRNCINTSYHRWCSTRNGGVDSREFPVVTSSEK
jgi:hypothetical protein